MNKNLKSKHYVWKSEFLCINRYCSLNIDIQILIILLFINFMLIQLSGETYEI